jgi:hypothetical protein
MRFTRSIHTRCRRMPATAYAITQLIAALVVALPTVALAQFYAVPVTDPAKQYQMDVFTLLPPKGRDWFEMKRDRRYVYFGKRLVSPTHSFIAVALSSPVSETFENAGAFRDYVITQLAENSGDQRNIVVLVATEIDASSGPFCVRYQLKTEDRGAAHAKGKTLLAETIGVSCLHPDQKAIAVDVSYTERGLPAETGTLLRDEGEYFVRSLRFTPPR